MDQDQNAISLSDDDKAFIEAEVAQGSFRSPAEVVHAGLLLLQRERQRLRLKELRALIAEGEADLEAGRFKDYGHGELAAEIRAMRHHPLSD